MQSLWDFLFCSSLQRVAYYIRRNNLSQKQRTRLEVEWGRRSGTNIRHLNIVPCFIFFHTAVFKNIRIKSIHQSHHPLGTKNPEERAFCQCTGPETCGRGRGVRCQWYQWESREFSMWYPGASSHEVSTVWHLAGWGHQEKYEHNKNKLLIIFSFHLSHSKAWHLMTL